MAVLDLGTKAFVFLASAALVAGCGDQPATTGGTAGGSPASSSSSSSSTSSGSGGAGGGIPVGHPPLAQQPMHTVGGFTISVPPVTLMPGEEQQPCFIFPLTIDGPSHTVGGGKLTVGAGMHHGNITTRPSTGTGIRPCPPDDTPIAGEGEDILKGGAVLFGSSTQIKGTEWQSFPQGMGYKIRDGFEIVARMHYLNTTTDMLTVAPEYEWYTIDEASLSQQLGPFVWTLQGWMIPPLSQLTVTSAACKFPDPMHLILLLPHMHRLGTRFTAGYVGGKFDGELFLDSPGYSPDKGVLTEYDPPGVDLSQGDGATFSCSWNNTLDQTIVDGVGNNEMCILFGYAYPPENAFTAEASEGGCAYVAPPAPP